MKPHHAVGLLALPVVALAVPQSARAQDPDPNVTVLERPRPDYDPLGIRSGGFLIFPELTLGSTYDDNIFASEDDEESDVFFSIAPEIAARSNFVRHRLDFVVGADIARYLDFDSEDYEDFFAGADGRLDIRRDTALNVGLDGGRFHQGRGDPEDEGGDRVEYYQYGGEVLLSQRFNRLDVGVGGSLERSDYGTVEAAEGDRDETDYDAILRLGYLVSPRFSVFTEGRYFVADRDAEPGDIVDGELVDVDRDFDGWEVRGGVGVDITAVLFGEAYLGYLDATFDDPVFEDVSGLSYGLDLTWNPTGLTTLTLSGDRDFEATQTAGASSRLRSRVGLGVDHELRRNIIIGGRVIYIRDDFEGIDRADDRFDIGGNISYLLNRYLALRGDYVFTTRTSDGDAATNDFDRNRVTLGITAQL